MIRSTYLVAFLIAAAFAAERSTAQNLHDTSKLTCSFTPDFNAGKSMEASCSRMPEKVFSTRFLSKEPGDHCDVNEMYESSAWTDFTIDFRTKLVMWNEETSPDPLKRQEYAEALAEKNGMLVEDAKEEVSKNLSRRVLAQVKHVEKSFDRNYIDPISGEFYDEPVLDTSMTILFTVRNDHYLLYVSDSTEAIVSNHYKFGDASWISMRFGRCRTG
ncbi:hypothetical protein [Hyphomonas sp.]|jgi:hypothetical protein|uniref:hypothetical protein n=1 Tax=Hyphomonas sp. TaxID=87 RepID=UPI0032D8E5D5